MPDQDPSSSIPPPDFTSGLVIQIPGYRLLDVIGRGGQATVYRAVDQSTTQNVAVKVLHAGPFADAASRERLQREIAALKELDHPNIVRILSSGQAPAGHDYLVMNYIEGRTLAEFWQDVMASSTGNDLLIQTFIQTCRAVGAAHARGIVHRDLNPRNIRIDPAGQPHVLDFGLARADLGPLPPPEFPDATLTGQFVGSLAYASPEQLRAAPNAITVRTDVYALGVMLYQILAGGRLPYSVTGDLSQALHNIAHVRPVPPGRNRPLGQAHASLDRVALQALEKDPLLRHASATELASDIENALAHRCDTSPRSRQRKAAVLMLLGTAAALAVYGGLRPALHARGLPQPHPKATHSLSTRPAPPASTVAIDLLKLVDPQRDVLHRGNWAFRDGVLISHADGGNELEFPYAASTEYDYRVGFVFPRDDTSMLMMFFPARAHQIAWAVGDRDNRASGFDLIDGKDVSQNLTTRWADKWLVSGKHHIATIKVRRTFVEAYFDDILICRYETDYHEIGLRAWMQFKRPDTPGLMVSMPGVKIEQAQLTEITGHGHSLR